MADLEEEIEDHIPELGDECIPSICTVTKEDFPRYLTAIQAADQTKVVGNIALALSTLGHLPNCAEDDAEKIVERLDLDKDDVRTCARASCASENVDRSGRFFCF